MFSDVQLIEILDKLRALSAETEVVEFKEAKNTYDFRKLGKYFSALSNEANLLGKPFAWLVFGIEDKHHTIVRSNFRKNRKDLDSLKGEIANKTTNRITFIEIYELSLPEGRIIMFQIPAAPKGIPIAFDGHYYGRDAQDLVPLNIEEIERIRAQSQTEDWSAAIVEEASLSDLDEHAIEVARTNYKNKFPSKAEEVDNWSDAKFLNKAKITVRGKVTRTAVLLLGKEESEHFINPAEAKIRWILKDNQGTTKDYKIVSCPLILGVDIIYKQIRNLKYRYMRDDTTLFPDEVYQYEPFTIREAINNCIAHQDYTMHGRINVIEKEDQLIFTNLGNFIPGSVEKVVKEDAPEEYYRNHFLANAMFNVKMVDTAGGGIRKMFNYQRQRLFQMPDYDLSDNRVQVTITGKVLDLDFARILIRNKDLSLEDIILLDKVQKKKPISSKEAEYLRKKKLIEGRKPNYFISIGVAKKIGKKADYSKNRGLDKEFYLEYIKKAIKQHGSMTRKEVDELLWKKLPNLLNDIQKKNMIGNLLSELRIKGHIKNNGTFKKPKWVICK